jgi:hypothetical protein
LLKDIAIEGNGSYGFIPDSGLVGTVFVNALSNLLCTTATRVCLSLEPMNGAKIDHPNNQIIGYNCIPASWGVSLPLGSLLFDQSRDVVFKMDFSDHKENTPYLFAKVSFFDINQ